jgi:hypothetical protein
MKLVISPDRDYLGCDTMMPTFWKNMLLPSSGKHFHLEDGGSVFLQNIGICLLDCTASCHNAIIIIIIAAMQTSIKKKKHYLLQSFFFVSY